MGKIYDCFTFFNELELLHIRLHELADKVDYFVLCEATSTFRGVPKPLYFSENKGRFSQFLPKIIHIVVDDLPLTGRYENDPELGERVEGIWKSEYFQRSAIRRGLTSLQPNDTVIISDCDEILRSTTIDSLKKFDGYSMLDLGMFQFYLNMEERPSGWKPAFAYSYRLDAQLPDYNAVRRNPTKTFESFGDDKQVVENAGWHFTFLGGKSKVQEKLSSYSHTDGWQRTMWDDNRLENQMLELRDVGGGKILHFRSVDETFPYYVQANVSELEQNGLIKSALTRIVELEKLWQRAYAANLDAERVAKNENPELILCKRLLLEIQRLMSSYPKNLVSDSKQFAKSWFRGVQREAPSPVRDRSLPLVEKHSSIMHHFRDSPSVVKDNNCGYFVVTGILKQTAYVASCWIWLPEDCLAEAIEISLGEWSSQNRISADTKMRSQWQRVYTTALSLEKPEIQSANVVMRASSVEPFEFFSTGWQVEEGLQPGPYYPTGV